MSLLLEEKRLFKKNHFKRVERWDELSQIEFLEVFNKLNAPWYDEVARYELMGWLYDHSASEKWLIEELTIRGQFRNQVFYGPGKGFRDLSMGQFMFADYYYFRYQNEKKPDDLNKLVAAIFIDKKCHDTICQAGKLYDQKQIDSRAERLKILPDHVHRAIIFNYGAVRRWLTQQFTHVFPKKQPDQVPRKLPLPRWDKHIWKLADGASDEDFRKIADSRALNILQKLDELIEESEKRKK